MYLKPEHELQVSSLCSCWDGPRMTTLEPRAHGSIALWGSFLLFLLLEGCLLPQNSLAPDSTYQSRIMILKMLCFRFFPTVSEGDLLEPLLFSLHPSPHLLPLKPPVTILQVHVSWAPLKNELCGYSYIPGDANSLFSLTLIVFRLRWMHF